MMLGACSILSLRSVPVPSAAVTNFVRISNLKHIWAAATDDVRIHLRRIVHHGGEERLWLGGLRAVHFNQRKHLRVVHVLLAHQIELPIAGTAVRRSRS